MGLRPAKSHEKLSGRRLADEILWGRLVTCGRLAIGPCRLRGGPAAVTNRRSGCQPAPQCGKPQTETRRSSEGVRCWSVQFRNGETKEKRHATVYRQIRERDPRCDVRL